MATSVDALDLPLIAEGKVRRLYRLPEPGRLLMVATDRISAYDHILSPEIPDKGKVLTGISLWWFDRLADLGILVAPGDFYGTAAHGRVRVALTATDERIEAAARRLTGEDPAAAQ